jgi:hypothetical protein
MKLAAGLLAGTLMGVRAIGTYATVIGEGEVGGINTLPARETYYKPAR